MSQPRRAHPVAGFWIGSPPAPGDTLPKLTPRLPPGNVIMYQRRADREWVHAIQDCFSDLEMQGHLDDAIPAHRKELAARFARLRARDLDLLARATPAQLAIGWGDYWYCQASQAAPTASGGSSRSCR